MSRQFFLSIFLCLLSVQAMSEELSATVGWSGKSLLSSSLTTRIIKLHVQAGDIVTADQVLVSLDCGQYQARFDESKALVNGLEPAVERAKKDKELADELFERTVLSEVEHRQAELLYIETKSKLDNVKAKLTENSWYKKQCQIKAPHPAIVLDVKAAEGELLNNQSQNTGLVEVADSTAMNLVAEVLLPLQRIYKPGEKMTAELAGKTFQARLLSVQFQDTVSARITAKIRHFDVRLIGEKNAKLISN